MLAAVVESTEIGLGLIMDDLVGAHVAALGESFATDFAVVWTFSGMPSLVCLEFSVSQDSVEELLFTHL